MKSYLYKTEAKAEEIGKKELGCDGAHKHKRGVWMPCSSHKEFIEKTKEQLTEIFNSETSINIKNKSNDDFLSEFVIDNETYFFRARQENLIKPESIRYGWHLTFGYGYDKNKYDLTNKNIPFKVLSAVKKCFEYFINEYNPEKMSFIAEGDTKAKLYLKLISGYSIKKQKTNLDSITGKIPYLYKLSKKEIENKGEIEELIDFDGTMLSSKIPILDPAVHPRKTTDQTVAATRITQDPLMRGHRTYFGENIVGEEDMSDAFGYEETKDMDAKDTIEYLSKELGLDKEDAEGRAEEMGKDENLDDSSKYKEDDDFVMRGRITEKEKMLSKEEVEKMAEDIVIKRTSDSDITPKEDSDVSPILQRNIRALKNLADIEGISKSKLVNLVKEQKEKISSLPIFIEELSEILSYDLTEDQVADYLEYWEDKELLSFYWEQGSSPEETINDLKDHEGKIYWYQ